MNKKIINTLLDAAIQAPSGDNVQPWEFKVSEDNTLIELYNLPDKDDSYYNYQQMASYIALGALIENIVITAGTIACKTGVILFPDANNDTLVARIKLSAGEITQEPLYEVIFKRSTNRFGYKKSAVTEKLLSSLSNAANTIEGTEVNLICEDVERKLLAKELMINDRLVFERKDIHAYLFDKIRWNKQQIEVTNDGMPVDTLGLSAIEKLSFPLMRFWWFIKSGNIFGLSRIIGLKCWWNCRNSSILGMVSIKGDDKSAFVNGGRAVQRVWLEATLNGLSLQPIIGLTLLIYNLKKDNLQGFSNKHREFIRKASLSLPKLFHIDKDKTLIMGFRAGLANELLVKTRRLSLSDKLIK